MADILLYSNFNNADTRVPNKFIDEYMIEANGEFVKVYLYLLRCLNSSNVEFSISTIADCFNHTDADIIRAIKYWEKQGLISVDYTDGDTIVGLQLISPESVGESALTSTVAPAPSVVTPATSVVAPATSVVAPATSVLASASVQSNAKKHEYTLDEIKGFKSNPDVSELFFIAEVYLKHPLSSSDINTILYWYDELHFHVDLISYLIEYCITKGHSSVKYMDKVAISWAEQNITTVELAKENAAAHSQIYYAVMKALGISGRNLVPAEQDFLNKWTKEFLFDNEIIVEACRRTISAIHQPSFEYTDTILSNWNKNQVHTLDDIKRIDEIFSKNKKVTVNTSDKPAPKRNKFNNINQRDYDFDQLEKMLLSTSVQ